MLSDDMIHNTSRADMGPISWWSWRPSIQPLKALLLGTILSLIGLVLAASGLITLIAPTLDHTTIAHPFIGCFLLLLSIIELLYPITLTRWGLRDLLIERYARAYLCQCAAMVIATRTIGTLPLSSPLRPHRPGILRSHARPWYGVALLPINGHITNRILVFAITHELYQNLHEGMQANIIYSPHLHYVYTLKAVNTLDA